jgi:hypothetical protein
LGNSPKFRRSAAGGWFEPRGTRLNAWFADRTSDRRGKSADRCRGSANRSWANHAWLFFAQWNSEHEHAGLEPNQPFRGRKRHAAVNSEPQQPE